MSRCLVAVGSNLGDRASLVHRAIERIGSEPAVQALVTSSLYETQPVGGAPGQHNFLNAAVAFDTSLAPEALHAVLQQIEHDLGRQRHQRWSARTIDLDLLFYDGRVLDTRKLVVPHPRMAFRRFVIEPAAEVAPDMVHPTIGWSLSRLREHLKTALPYVALLATDGSGSRALAQRVATAVGARYLAGPESRLPSASLAGGDASPAHAREIELLRQRAAMLHRATWPAAGVLTVSDFYLDQGLAYAETALSTAEFAAFRREFEQQAAQVVLPKLLVVLDTRPSVAGRGSPAAAVSDQETLRGRLLALATRPGLGPVLYAGRDEPDAHFDEISAAIEAMETPPLDV
jgi:2-amino-4-hydroxy-6-hydroxymethyldihydropteridine diphosphokinase